MAHEDVLIAGDEDPDEGGPPPPRKRLVRSATAGWVWVEEGNVEHWDDDHLWHDRPPC